MRPSLPQGDFQTARQPCLELTFWGSLELHIYPDAPSVARALRAGSAGHPQSPARRGARCPLLRREVSGQVALCGEGESVARPAADPVGFGRDAFRRRLDRRGAAGALAAARRDAVLHAPGQDEERDRRSLSRARRAHVQPRHGRGAGEDRRAPTDGEPAKDLNLLRAPARFVANFPSFRSPPSSASTSPMLRRLLQRRRQHCDALGMCFHVGSQAMTPFAYVQALERVRAAIAEAAVIDRHRSMSAAVSRASIRAWSRRRWRITSRSSRRHFEALPISYSAELWCEPGRALCAEYSSLIVKVEKRRGNELYINDGAYGALFDAAHVAWRFPVAALEDDLRPAARRILVLRPDLRRCRLHEGPVHAARPTSRPATTSRSACSAPMARR